LDAVAAIESGRAPGIDWSGRAKELLDHQAAAEKTSEGMVQAVTMQQPPADLLISITPGVRTLVEAVVSLGPRKARALQEEIVCLDGHGRCKFAEITNRLGSMARSYP
jgi:hypothetical protein